MPAVLESIPSPKLSREWQELAVPLRRLLARPPPPPPPPNEDVSCIDDAPDVNWYGMLLTSRMRLPGVGGSTPPRDRLDEEWDDRCRRCW